MKITKDEEAIMEEFRVFGYYDSRCKLDHSDELTKAQLFYRPFPLCEPKSARCRPWLLTEIIDRSLKGIDGALTWCDETGGRLFMLQNALDYIIENIEWEKVSSILKVNGLDDDWLSDRIDRFESWIELFYFDEGALEDIYQAAEEDMRSDIEWEKTKDWLMHNYD